MKNLILVEFSLPVFYAISVSHLHRIGEAMEWWVPKNQNNGIREFGARRPLYRNKCIFFFFFHDSDGKNWGPERSYIQFIPELGLEAKPAYLDQFSSLPPRVSNKGIHMNLEVRHSQAEMSPITGWLLWCEVVNTWPQREAEVSAVMRCEFPSLLRRGESSKGQVSWQHKNTKTTMP